MNYASEIVNWYHENKRDLPFRHTSDPYHIWVSEIMLQQTTVTAVIPYYNRFINRFPTIDTLAKAPLEEVYKYWEGLGYYRRAKHLHESAQLIMDQYQGCFPDTYADLKRLKGIGDYTASAIMSICYHESYPAVDGNLLRVTSRIHGLYDNIAETKTKKTISMLAKQAMSDVDPSAFNQGMMDFAHAICQPSHPRCDLCFLTDICQAYQRQETTVLPVNIKAIKKEDLLYTTGIITYQDQIMMMKNPPGLLENMYGLIQYECEGPISFIEAFHQEFGLDLTVKAYLKEFKHVFTHRTWHMHVYHFMLSAQHPLLYEREALKKLPIPTAHKKILTYFESL